MAGYNFTGRFFEEYPRDTTYTFHLAVKSRGGAYGMPDVVTVTHPGINKLILPETNIKSSVTNIRILMPKVYSIHDQQVYPTLPDPPENTQEKDIVAYRIHIQELVYDTELPTEDDPDIVDFEVESETSSVFFYEAKPHTKYEIKVGAYDSVYHPDHNPTLYESTISDPVIVETSLIKVTYLDLEYALVTSTDPASLLTTSATLDDTWNVLLYTDIWSTTVDTYTTITTTHNELDMLMTSVEYKFSQDDTTYTESRTSYYNENVVDTIDTKDIIFGLESLTGTTTSFGFKIPTNYTSEDLYIAFRRKSII